MKHLKFIVAIVILLAVLIIIVQNDDALSKSVVFKLNLLSIHWKSSAISIYYIVTVAFLFGVLITGLYGIIERFRLKKEIRLLTTASEAKERELNSLRNLPITEEPAEEEVESSEQGPELKEPGRETPDVGTP